MRVTDGMRQAQVERNLSGINSRYAKASNQALTGRRIDTPSDDPWAAAELVRLQGSLSEIGTQRATIKKVQGDAELAEGVLGEAGALFDRAREIAMQGANGSLNGEQRAALATEVAQLSEQLVSLANTRGSRGYLFSGSQTDTRPFDASGAFSGDDAVQLVDIGLGNATAVNASGAQAFTAAGGRDVFADLEGLRAALAADDPAAVSASLGGLDAARQQLILAQSKAGLTVSRLQTSDDLLSQAELNRQESVEHVAAADPYETYSNLTILGQSLERAVEVARRVLDLGSLFRF